jgi:2-C-methyl-D-erythritol 2,4-cyclodiphosphate synthase
MFTGIGYDVHKLVKGRKLILGGVNIPHIKGLLGHSDADVLIHAAMDALLGAAGLSDIGHLFPNNDPKYKNADSIALLKEVVKVLASKKLTVNNIDISLICEKPKIAPHIAEMKKNLSAALKLPAARIGIKATTNEGMGFLGRGEGIAAFSTCSLKTRNKQ